MHHSLPIAILIALALTGCAVPTPLQEAPPAAPPVEAAQAPAAPVAQGPAAPAPAPAVDFSGRAESQAGAFAGATVTVTILGSQEVLASATTGADGAFGVDLPASVPAGALLKVVATRDGQSLATLVAAPGDRKTASDDAPTLSDASTLAYLLLDRRFAAAGQASRDGHGQVFPEAANATFDAFRAFVEGCGTALAGQSGEARQAVRQAVASSGPQALPAAVAQQLGASQLLVNYFERAVSALDAAILAAVRQGGTEPAAELLAPMGLGRMAVPGLSLHASGGSSGGGSSTPAAPSVGGTVAVTSGGLGHTGSESIQLSN